ncbi:MAG: hypothetical protein HKN45_06915 [Flavobacteriales bacterium]|nr:hypothetical protein [Flavobacteriales bacterium]
MIISFLGVFRFHVDVALAIWAIAGFVMAYSIYLLVSYFIQPAKLITISTKVELKSPPRILKSVQNYRLKVSSEKHIEEKGRERSVKMDELIMSFNSSDHPDAYDYCMRMVSSHMDACIESAKLAHPDAEVIGSPLQLPPEIKLLEGQ